MLVRTLCRFIVCALAAVALAACSIGGQYGKDPNFRAPVACQVSAADAPQNIQDIFPWPPPRGSNEQKLTAQILDPLRSNGRQPTLGDIDRHLTELMGGEDQPPFTYYTTPDASGFAAVTRVDPIDASGRKIGRSSESGSWLGALIRGSLYPPEGRSRVLLFLVTNSPDAQGYSPGEATSELAKKWIDSGCGTLPSTLAKTEVDENYQIYVRSYEFFTRDGKSHLVSRSEHALAPSQQLATLGASLDTPK